MKAEGRAIYRVSDNAELPCWAYVRVRFRLEGDECILRPDDLPNAVYYDVNSNQVVQFLKNRVDIYCYEYTGTIWGKNWETLRKHVKTAVSKVMETVKESAQKALERRKHLEELERQTPPEEVWEQQL